jgi:alkanesulfonate monooxygenase SsuD/methylene tetrahydromethanopterin reductase-like flavin-dependent oxidoreductase (luciferase family)
MIGGGGEKRTLKLVAQYADACNITGGPDQIRHKLDVLRSHCEAVGRDPSEITVTRLATLFLTDSAQETGQITEFMAGAAGADAVAGANIGQEDEVVEQVRDLADAGVQEFIFNLPLADAAGIRRAGSLFASAFS